MSAFGLPPYQLAIALLSIVMLADGFYRFARGGFAQSWLKLLVRLVTWGGLAVIALFPGVSYALANAIGIEGNLNAVILIGFLLVFLMIFKMLAVVERLEQQITRLVRRDALQFIKTSKLSGHNSTKKNGK
jgi:hypothetical protein